MRINGISGGYSDGFFISDISFNLEEGKIYALLGLNGSGKTTIIKMICGLIKLKSGNITIGEKDLFTLKEKERAKLISYVPQSGTIVYYTTVVDVVLMGATPYLNIFQTPAQEHREQALECLKILGISEFADRNYLDLSEGQKQIVVIARALMQKGKYMLMDEPESSLDLINKNNLMKKIREIIINMNKSCVISMHNPEYALNYCDRILLLKDKKITEIDLKTEDINMVEKKLSEIYGQVKILEYNQKYMLYYSD